jgi:hypothetical protein
MYLCKKGIKFVWGPRARKERKKEEKRKGLGARKERRERRGGQKAV